MARTRSKINNLLPSGDNLALVNPRLFLRNERIRTIAAARAKWFWYPPEPTSSPPSTPQSFHCFEHLPTKLRLVIWRLSRLPRVIEVEKGKEGDSISWTLAPAMMHVCHESRTVGLEVYNELKGMDKYGQHVSVWIDWKEDVIMFKSGRDLQAFMTACTKAQNHSDDDGLDEADNNKAKVKDNKVEFKDKKAVVKDNKAKVKNRRKAQGEDAGNASLINSSAHNLAMPKSSFIQFEQRFRISHHFYSLTQLILIQTITPTLDDHPGNLTLIDSLIDHRSQAYFLNFPAKNDGFIRAIVRDAERDNRRLLEGDEWEEEYKRREEKRKMNKNLLVAAKIQTEDLVHETKAENHSQ